MYSQASLDLGPGETGMRSDCRQVGHIAFIGSRLAEDVVRSRRFPSRRAHKDEPLLFGDHMFLNSCLEEPPPWRAGDAGITFTGFAQAGSTGARKTRAHLALLLGPMLVERELAHGVRHVDCARKLRRCSADRPLRT